MAITVTDSQKLCCRPPTKVVRKRRSTSYQWLLEILFINCFIICIETPRQGGFVINWVTCIAYKNLFSFILILTFSPFTDILFLFSKVEIVERLSNLPNNETKRFCTDYNSSCSCEFSITGEKGKLFTPQNITLRRRNVINKFWCRM